MITDRRRCGGDPDDALVGRVAEAARAGVHLVQVREPDLEGGALLRLVARCVDAVRASRTRIVVNDRVDVALAAGAHGVHLRGDSVAASRVRAIVPAGFLVGRSVHSTEDAVRAAAGGGIDYLLFGTVFSTPSKAGRAAAGAAALGRVVASVRVPVLAVGGATAATAPLVAAAGAAGLAAIGLFHDGPVEGLRDTVGAARRAFAPGGARFS